MPKISIIVPVYNEEEYVSTCLDSLVKQTLDDIEIITIDDNSTDNSLNILLDYARKYPNIKVYHNEKNIGQGASRNRGLKLATGEYIGFVDSDDYVRSTMYEDMYKALVNNNYPELVTTEIIFVKDDSYANIDLEFLARGKEKIINPIQDRFFVISESPTVCNKIFRKDTLKDFYFVEDSLFEDIPFSYTKYMEASKVVAIPSINYFYRRDINRGVSSINYRENSHITDIFKVLDRLDFDIKNSSRYEIFKDEIKLIQLAYSLIRVEEINNWDLDEEKKILVKDKMFSLIEEKYGNLDSVDITLLQSKCGINICDEYTNYLDNEKEKIKSLKNQINMRKKIRKSLYNRNERNY